MSRELLDMLEPSFALVKRHQTDQHRLATESDLKLQNQLNQTWERIHMLEGHTKQLEIENTVLKDRVAWLEKNNSATELDSASPETKTPSVRSTPSSAHVYAFETEGLEHLKLHPALPGVLFVIEPATSKLSDDSEFPLSLLSSLRSITAQNMADERIVAKRFDNLQSNNSTGNPFTAKDKCHFRYLENHAQSGRETVWTKEHQHFYACKACVNKQRLCISIEQGQAIALPLHPVFRVAPTDHGPVNKEALGAANNLNGKVRPDELHYWIAATAMATKHLPHNIDFWCVTSGSR